MIALALKYLTDLAREGMSPKEIATGDPTKTTFLVSGKTVEISKPVPFRAHEVDSIDSLVELANRFAEVGPVIWIDETAVSLVIDDEEHRANTARIKLRKTDVWKTLCRLEHEKAWMDQKAFVRLLRIDLAGTLPPGILLDRVRKIRFESGQVTTQEAAKNRESMGRQITNAVTADDELPDGVTLEVAVFECQDKFSVACSVDVDPARGLLQLAPLPDELQRVIDLAVANLSSYIAAGIKDSVPIYNGRP